MFPPEGQLLPPAGLQSDQMKITPACGQLEAFVLAAQSGKMVPPDLADAWTAQAEEIMLLLKC